VLVSTGSLVLLPVRPPPLRRVDGVVCTGAGALSSSAWVAPISDDSQSEPSAADAAPLNQSGNPSPRPPDMEAFPAAVRLVVAPAGPPGHDAAVAPAGGAPELLKTPVAALSDPPVRAVAILAPAAGAPGPPDPLMCVLRPPAAGRRSWFIGTLARGRLLSRGHAERVVWCLCTEEKRGRDKMQWQFGSNYH
jgi:hypothetical protein